jgi:hypothetical protein
MEGLVVDSICYVYGRGRELVINVPVDEMVVLE